MYSIYPPTGGAEGGISSTGSGVTAEAIAKHKAKVDDTGKKGMVGRKAKAVNFDATAVNQQVLKDELTAQEKRVVSLTAELKKTKGLLAERTTESKGTKQSLSENNRARSNTDRGLLCMSV